MLAFLALARAADPTSVAVTYTVAFDMNATGDQICKATGICDCTSTYVGEGTLQPGETLTYKGTWKMQSNTCNANFQVWAPPDGQAFHTFRKDATSITEWVVHGDVGGSVKMNSGMKQNRQFWMDALAIPWPTKGTAQAVQKDGSDLAMGVRVDATHTLALTFK